uniref:Uncharacterized protein n=1 Tax=Physcomitrium patens TaxID=3218 RepID=A0A2K1KF20_PHYPA|nr:hypothetical protein PHYPA_008750 [Physcomitrium patens]
MVISMCAQRFYTGMVKSQLLVKRRNRERLKEHRWDNRVLSRTAPSLQPPTTKNNFLKPYTVEFNQS